VYILADRFEQNCIGIFQHLQLAIVDLRARRQKIFSERGVSHYLHFYLHVVASAWLGFLVEPSSGDIFEIVECERLFREFRACVGVSNIKASFFGAVAFLLAHNCPRMWAVRNARADAV